MRRWAGADPLRPVRAHRLDDYLAAVRRYAEHHTAARAGEICAKTLAEYEPPPLDDAVRAELDDYVTRRRAELGD